MTSFKAKITDPIGLHARPASITVAEATKFSSDITITSGSESGNLKSIMNIMALGVKQGQTIEIKATGADEVEAIRSIKDSMSKNNLI